MRRSLHFVPGGNERMMAKALTLPADGLILALEDAVTPARKAETRPIGRLEAERDALLVALLETLQTTRRRLAERRPREGR